MNDSSCLNTCLSVRYRELYRVRDLKEPCGGKVGHEISVLLQQQHWEQDPDSHVTLKVSCPSFVQVFQVKVIQGFGTSYCKGLHLFCSLTCIDKQSPCLHHTRKLLSCTCCHKGSLASSHAYKDNHSKAQTINPKHPCCFTDHWNLRDAPVDHV